jgi:hypothetical protein
MNIPRRPIVISLTFLFTSALIVSLAYLRTTARPKSFVTNSPPVAVDDAFTVHGYTRLGSVLANDHDPDGDPIGANPISQPTHGSLFGTETTGVYDYSPNGAYVGSDSFTYEVCDNHGGCSSATVSLTINNNPPVGVSDSYTVHGTTRIGPVQANDTDPDGDQLLFSNGLTFPTHGTLFGTETTGAFDYKRKGRKGVRPAILRFYGPRKIPQW